MRAGRARPTQYRPIQPHVDFPVVFQRPIGFFRPTASLRGAADDICVDGRKDTLEDRPAHHLSSLLRFLFLSAVRFVSFPMFVQRTRGPRTATRHCETTPIPSGVSISTNVLQPGEKVSATMPRSSDSKSSKLSFPSFIQSIVALFLHISSLVLQWTSCLPQALLGRGAGIHLLVVPKSYILST